MPTPVARPLPQTRRAPLVLVVNARASGVKPELVAAIEAETTRWGARHSTVVTESPVEWIELVGGDPDRRVVFVGGDGTVHAAVNATTLRPEIALVPAGRANNIARSLGIPIAFDAAVRLAVEGREQPIDLIRASTPTASHVTVEAVSLGFLAQARSYYHAENSAHLVSAVAAGAHALTEFHPLRLRVATPTFTRELTVTQLFVANLPLYEFGLHVAPAADVTDELLDIVAIEAGGRAGVPPMLHQLVTGRGGGRKVSRWRVPHARIDLPPESPIVADSFDLGSGPLEVRVLPRDLRIVRP